MKTYFSCSLIVPALVVGTLGLFNSADAQPLKALGRFRQTDGERRVATAGAVQKRQLNRAAPAAPVGYAQYRLIDLGTLGGPASGAVFPARALNNRREMIGLAETAIIDPNCYFDCYIMHGFLRQKNGNMLDLPFPPGIDSATNVSLAGDITGNGLLSGFVTNGSIDPLTEFPQTRAVVWGRNGATPIDLGTLGGSASQAAARNQYGDTVGVALNDISENPDFASFMNGFLPAATQARPFLWQGNGLQDLGTLGGNDAFASAINDAGLIFGLSYTDTVPNETTGLPTIHPFLWSNGSMQDLGSLGGSLAMPGGISYFYGGPVLNQRGDAIGTSTLAGDEFWHAFVWTSGSMQDLGTLGGNLSEALAINETGTVVGRADFSPDSPYHHAVLWRNGAINDLGVVDPCKNSTATSINSAGDVVGGLGVCTDNPHNQNYFSAFLWQKGKPIADLNSLISPASDMHIEFATAINDRGEIVGDAYSETGDIHVILLVPIADR